MHFSKLFAALLLVCALVGCSVSQLSPGQPAPRADGIAWDWPTSTPEEQGIHSALLAETLQRVRDQGPGLHSLLIIRNGHLVSEAYFTPYRRETKHHIYSCTKSVLSALVGIAIQQGNIPGVEAHLLEQFFPGSSPAHADAAKDAITLEHLLTMTSGLDWVESDPTFGRFYNSPDWVQFILDLPMAHPSGDRFNYCSGCSHLLSAIIEQAAGMSTLDFARHNLFEPLAISDFNWETDRSGRPIGGWGLHLTPRDMAKLGQLYLQNGVWDGEQVIPAEWVQTSVARHTATDSELGYGYQWWTDPRLPGFAALGLGGQTILVIPDLELVIVTTADEEGYDTIYPLIAESILPAIAPNDPLPADTTGLELLQAQIQAAAAGK